MFKHEHLHLYLYVGLGGTWMIGSTIDSIFGRIQSGSAGSVCPAHPSNRVNNRKGQWKWIIVLIECMSSTLL